MSTAVKRRGQGTRSDQQNFIGQDREWIHDGSRKTIRVHDGVTAGGNPLARQFSINVKEYGAKGNGSTNDTAAVRLALADAAILGASEIIFPCGQYVITGSLDFTSVSSGLVVRGHGSQTQLLCSVASKCIIDCTGKDRLTFKNFWIVGGATEPDAAFLFARDSSNASAGLHTLENVKVTGGWAKAGVVGISAEVLTFLNSTVENQSVAAGTMAYSITDQNERSVTSEFKAFPATWTGGNTVIKWIGGAIEVASATGIQVDLKNVRDVSFHGTFFSVGGVTGMQITNANALCISGCSSEWNGTYGIRIMPGGSGVDLINSKIQGTFAKGIYAEDLTTIRNVEFWGPFFATASINAYNMYNCIVSNRGLGLTVRNESQGNKFIGANDTAFAAYTLPAISRGDVVETQAECSDGTVRGYFRYFDDSRSRLVTHFIKPKGIQYRTQAPAFATPMAPAIDLGCTLALVLTANIVFSDFTYGNYQPGASQEGDGLEFTFILKQDATGGRTVTFPAAWITNWTPDTTAGKTNTITIRYSATIGKWVQISAATGL